MTAEWDAVLAEGERLLRAWAGNQPVEREWRLWVDANMPTLLSAALRERESAKVARRYRSVLLDLRIQLHAAGRRPEECYEMSIIDAALAAEKGEQT